MAAVLARLAAPRAGIVGHRRARAAGVTADALRHRLRTGSLHEIHRGVYSVGHRALSDDGWYHAAIEAAGGGAVLGHLSAARRFRLLTDVPLQPVHLTLPRDATYVRRKGVAAHRPMDLDALDTTCDDGLPTVTVPRVLLEIALAVDGDTLALAVHRARVEWRMPMEALRAVMDRAPRARSLRRLHDVAFGRPVAPNRRERRFLELVDEAGLPRPSVNPLVDTPDGTWMVDALWPAQRLIYEIDDLASHTTAHALIRDRRRDAALQDAGFRVRRVTDDDLWPRATRTIARLTRQLRGA